MKEQDREMVRPEIPLGLDAVDALAKLAHGFLPLVDLLGTATTLSPAGSGAKPPVTSTQARYQILIDQLPAATFMAWFENGDAARLHGG
jgi:hypothetical protein